MVLAHAMESEVFGPVCDRFQWLIGQLNGEVVGQMEHGAIEALIFTEGTELLRCLMQANLDLRAIREVRRYDVTSPDGDSLTHCRPNCER